MAKDPLLRLGERGSGVEAEPVDEHRPGTAKGGERIRLPAGAVLGLREQPPPVLPRRLLGHQTGEEGQGLVRLAGIEQGRAPSSSASPNSSTSRSTSIRAGAQSVSSGNGAPRHSPSASSIWCSVRSG